MGAQDGPQLLVAAFADQVEIHLAESREESVAVGEDSALAVRIGHAIAVVRDLSIGECGVEEAVSGGLHPHSALTHDDVHTHRAGLHRAHDRALPVRVCTEDGVGVVVGARMQPGERVGGERGR